jgi:kynureninase
VLSDDDLQGITASGPPLSVLLHSLELLRDLRLAVDNRNIATRHNDLMALRSALIGGA